MIVNINLRTWKPCLVLHTGIFICVCGGGVNLPNLSRCATALCLAIFSRWNKILITKRSNRNNFINNFVKKKSLVLQNNSARFLIGSRAPIEMASEPEDPSGVNKQFFSSWSNYSTRSSDRSTFPRNGTVIPNHALFYHNEL